jgi:hypothetical protein
LDDVQLSPTVHHRVVPQVRTDADRKTDTKANSDSRPEQCCVHDLQNHRVSRATDHDKTLDTPLFSVQQQSQKVEMRKRGSDPERKLGTSEAAQELPPASSMDLVLYRVKFQGRRHTKLGIVSKQHS